MQEDFYYQLAKTIQAWLSVELETFNLYANIMKGAHPHLISATFHKIESFDSKLSLIDSCLALFFTKDSIEWKDWRSLLNKARKLNARRNKLVHQPVHEGFRDGMNFIEISPSFVNALALSKGQTSYSGPVIDPEYKPSMAKLNPVHRIDFEKLKQYETEFEEFSKKIRSYRGNIAAAIKVALGFSEES